MSDHRIHTEADLDRGIDALVAADPRFAALIAKAGRPPLRRRADGFAGLASTVVSQQLSDRERQRDLGPACRGVRSVRA